MLRRSFRYLIIGLVLFLSFGNEVLAANIPEITCKYYNDTVNWLISQNRDGTGFVYRNKTKDGSSVTENTSGWEKITTVGNLLWGDDYDVVNRKLGTKVSKSNPKYLQNCPVGIINKSGNKYIFNSKSSNGYKYLNGGDAVIKLQKREYKYVVPAIGNTGNNNKGDTGNGDGDAADTTIGFVDNRDQQMTCEDIFGEDGEIIKLLKTILNLVKIVVPILIIVLGSLDFVSAIFANDENNMKKAQAKFIKRLVVGVAIFLVPGLLSFLLGIANQIWPIVDASLCGIL